MRKLVLLLVLVAPGCCVTKAELAADVKAWRAFYDAVRPDLAGLYGGLPEPSRSTRLGTLEQQDATIKAAERRAGIAPAASSS